MNDDLKEWFANFAIIVIVIYVSIHLIGDFSWLLMQLGR